MAHWTIRARLIDLGVMEIGSDFITYNGVKVVTPDGKREFLSKLTMHNEINSIFTETQGEFVPLYLSGRRNRYPAVLHGMKTENENVYFGASPLKPYKVQALLYLIVSVPLCLVLFGFLSTPFLIWWHCYLSFWDPPRRKVFDEHEPGTEVNLSGSPRKRLVGRQAA